QAWLAAYEKEHGNLVPVTAVPLTRPDRETAAHIAALVRQLGSDQFAEREAAVRELTAVGQPALEAVRQAAAGAEDAEVRQRAADLVVRIRERGQLRCLTGPGEPVRGVALSADGRVAVSAAGDHTVRVWDTATGQELHVCRGHTDAVLGVALAPD